MGRRPTAGVIADQTGALYGTTANQGANGQGMVFKLTPPSVSGGSWTESIVWTFTGVADGGGPTAGLLMDAAGVIYGSTGAGGSFGCGTFFQLLPPATSGGAWTENTLTNFPCGPNGLASSPGDFVRDQTTGTIYGTVQQAGQLNGGWIYRLTPPAVGGSSETRCGFYNGCGTIFQLTPSSGGVWTETVLQDFVSSGGDAINPNPGRLLLRSGTLYGASYQGGASNLGAVYAVHP